MGVVVWWCPNQVLVNQDLWMETKQMNCMHVVMLASTMIAKWKILCHRCEPHFMLRLCENYVFCCIYVALLCESYTPKVFSSILLLNTCILKIFNMCSNFLFPKFTFVLQRACVNNGNKFLTCNIICITNIRNKLQHPFNLGFKC